MRKKRLFLSVGVLAAGLWVAQAAIAQSTSEIPDDLRKKTDAVFSANDKPDSPGCTLGVIRDGRMIYARGYGMANLDLGVPIAPSTVFDIGSTSKQFTAASILLLAGQGKLSLDDDIRKLVPEMPDYGHTITIRHLLHHTSGLRDYLTLMDLAGVDFDGVTTADDALRLIVRQKELNFAPGDEYLYSNSGFFLLGVIVERASGQSLAAFAKENIFAPLGMAHTHYHDDHTMIVPRRATGYAPVRSGGFRIDMSGFEQTGDGAVYTTVEDLLLWDRNFYKPTVGGSELVRELQVTGVLNNGEELTYARGLRVSEHKGLKTASHGGSWAGYRAELLRFPDEKFSVACLCNVANANPSQLARQVAEVFLGERMTEPAKPKAESRAAVSLSEAEWKEKVGLYRGAEAGALVRIRERDGKLWIQQFGLPPEELLAVAKNRFRVADWPPSSAITFEPAAPGAKPRFRFARENARPEEFEAIEEFTPSVAQLAEYGGTYYSGELDVTYRVAREGDLLTAGVKNQKPRALEPTYRDAFAARGRQFEFTRDAQGRVAGFTVQAGRVRNIRFVREP